MKKGEWRDINEIYKTKGRRQTHIKNKKINEVNAIIGATIEIQRYIRGYLVRLYLNATDIRQTIEEENTSKWISRLEHVKQTKKPLDFEMAIEWIQGRFKMIADKNHYGYLVNYHKYSIYNKAARCIQNAYRNHKQQLLKKYGPHCFVVKGKIRYYDERNDCAARIQRAWKAYLNREIYQFYRDLIKFREMGNPKEMLKSINPREAGLLDEASGAHVRFRLGGAEFPPTVYYKIYIHAPICDIGAFAPRNYTQYKKQAPIALHNKQQLKQTIINTNNKKGWYERRENNGWRPVTENLIGNDEKQAIMEYMGGQHERIIDSLQQEQPTAFHYSKIKRKQDVAKRKSKKRLAWMQKMYKLATTQVMASKKEVSPETPQSPDMEEEELPDAQDVLKWCEQLDYQDYITEWQTLATSISRPQQQQQQVEGEEEEEYNNEQKQTLLEAPIVPTSMAYPNESEMETTQLANAILQDNYQEGTYEENDDEAMANMADQILAGGGMREDQYEAFRNELYQ